MKLSISNIAWEHSELEDHLALISRLGCRGLELAPSCVWPDPVAAAQKDRRDFKALVDSYGVDIIGLHALLFTRPDLELFGSAQSRRDMGDYLKQLFELCADLGGQVLTFGSPKNRRVGDRDYAECTAIAVDFFSSLMPAAKAHQVILCPEFLSRKETDFLTSSQEALNLVSAVGNHHFMMHLDIKALIDAGEDAADSFRRSIMVLKHVHVADPGLAPPGSTGIDHRPMGAAVQKSGYDHYVSIEMRRGFGPSREVVEKSIRYVQECYGIT